jgi:hypothetical protein
MREIALMTMMRKKATLTEHGAMPVPVLDCNPPSRSNLNSDTA